MQMNGLLHLPGVFHFNWTVVKLVFSTEKRSYNSAVSQVTIATH